MMSMVERVARAMQAVDDDLGGAIELSDGEARALAVAAIKAMREPTDAMVDSAADFATLGTIKCVWSASIDAAINEQSS